MRRHVIVHGRVQGVGFRYFTQRTAAEFGLTGWVRNCADGTVEAELQGSPATVAAALAILHDGPTLGYVDHLTIDERPDLPDERDFRIRH